MNSLYLAWRYIHYHRLKSGMIVLALCILLYLPLGLNQLVQQAQNHLMDRAVATPLLLGPRGSALDLVIDALYFQHREQHPIPYSTRNTLQTRNPGKHIPVYSRFNAQGHTIIGTHLEYFDFRKLQMQQGHSLSQLGECVLGATVAKDLALNVGGTLTSSPENVFDLAGAYPLKMHIAGILAPTGTPDDDAVFVDLKTAWILTGLLHGHDALDENTDKDLLLKQSDSTLTANAKLEQFMEITDENRSGFHFHGDQGEFPITAVIYVPENQKAHDLALGHYQSHETLQLVAPHQIIENLLSTLFRIRDFISAGYMLVALATGLLLTLIIALSLRLRESEMRTMMEIGCARNTLIRLLTAELATLLLASLLLAGVLLALTNHFAPQLLNLLWSR